MCSQLLVGQVSADSQHIVVFRAGLTDYGSVRHVSYQRSQGLHTNFNACANVSIRGGCHTTAHRRCSSRVTSPASFGPPRCVSEHGFASAVPYQALLSPSLIVPPFVLKFGFKRRDEQVGIRTLRVTRAVCFACRRLSCVNLYCLRHIRFVFRCDRVE